MLRIKKEHLGKRIGKGNDFYVLSPDLSQRQLNFIKNMVGGSFVEEYNEELERAKAEVKAYMENE